MHKEMQVHLVSPYFKIYYNDSGLNFSYTIGCPDTIDCKLKAMTVIFC